MSLNSMKKSLAVCVLFFGFQSFVLADGKLEVHFIDVGQGGCTLIKCANGRRILVDCGSTGGGDKQKVRSYILEQLNADAPHLDVLNITHPDADHYNLIPYVLANVSVDEVMIVGKISEYSKADCDEWLERVESLNILPKEKFDPSDMPNALFGDGETEFFILAADIHGTKSPKNARSIVLGVSYKDFDVMLTGDATFATEKKILERYDAEWLDFEVLKIGHHGSSTTSTGKKWAPKQSNPKLPL